MPETLTILEVEQLIARFSAEERYLIVERLGIMYEDKPITREQAVAVIRAETN